METLLSQDLLPCPFCGSEAVRDEGYGGYVRCSNVTDAQGGCFMALDWVAADKWNRRVAPKPSPQENCLKCGCLREPDEWGEILEGIVPEPGKSS